MNFTNRQTTLFFIIVPIVMLLIGSGHSAYSSLSEYLTAPKSNRALKSISMLQSSVDAFYEEIICVAKSHSAKRDIGELCRAERKRTDVHIALIDKYADDKKGFSTNNVQENQNWERITDKFRAVVGEIRYDIDVHRDINIKELIEGDYQTQILEAAQKRIMHLKNSTALPKAKRALELHAELSARLNSTYSEHALIAYYLAANIPIPPVSLAYWDSQIALTSLPVIEGEEYLRSIMPLLKSDLVNKNIVETMKSIERARVEIIADHENGNYGVKPETWDANMDRKQRAIQGALSTLENYAAEDFDGQEREQIRLLLLVLLLTLLSILSLFYFYSYYRRIGKEDAVLKRVMTDIDRLSDESEADADGDGDAETLKAPTDFGDKESVYAYIDTILQQLHDKEKQANAANAAKSLFLANMSHEIRTPLNGISGFTELLKDTPLNEDQSEFVSIIKSSADHLVRVVNDVLDISKLSAEQMVLEYTDFNIHEAIDTVVNMFSNRTVQKDIILSIYMNPDIPQYLIGDPTKLSQVLTNLMTNAIKFTDHYGSIDIVVDISESSRDEMALRFSVTDSGIGIPEEKIDTIFEAFGQVSASTSREYGGTGLGLTIASKIVNLMGGKLDIQSEVDVGTEFFFTVPLHKGPKTEPKLYPSFSGLHIGLLLPLREIDRQPDRNIEKYMCHLGTKFSFYTHKEILTNHDGSLDGGVKWPDIMLIDHHYSTLEGELEKFSTLPCPSVLLTTSILKQRVMPEKHPYQYVVYNPMTIDKCVRILEHSRMEPDTAPQKSTTATPKKKRSEIRRILVADDNPVNRKLIAVLLERFNCSVTFANNGQEALDLFKADHFDSVYMDIEMPVMNGLEATKAILDFERENQREHTLIVAVSANTESEHREEYRSAGMDDFLPKPFSAADLKMLLKRSFPDDFSGENERERSKQRRDSGPYQPSRSASKKSDKQTLVLYTRSKLMSRILKSLIISSKRKIDIVENEAELLESIENNHYDFAVLDNAVISKEGCIVANYIKSYDATPLVLMMDEKLTKPDCFEVLAYDVNAKELKDRLSAE